MRRNLWLMLIFIIILTGLAGVIDWPNGPAIFGRQFKVQQGLDLQGGTQLIYQADLSKSQNKRKDLENLRNVFDSRINKLGVAEPSIQIAGKDRVIIELPGVKNLSEAKSKIGATYELLFMTEDDKKGKILNDYYSDQPYPGKWVPTALTGSQLSKASVGVDNQSLNSGALVSMTFNREGKTLFANITKKNLQKRIAIVLDNKIVSAPTVQTEIINGEAQITGLESMNEAQNLTKRLNEGMLPVPAKLIGQNTVGATLGNDSVKKSLIAGLIGLMFVALFMIIYYKIPGLLAVLILTLYALFNLALIKLIPITLTLTGIAGFILSIGMAVDANILIFERMKEELHAGRPLSKAIEEGFRRAMSSIVDSNTSSLITCFILYVTTTGFVRGFALTLGLGIILSLFTAITVSRTFLRLFVNTRLERAITNI